METYGWYQPALLSSTNWAAASAVVADVLVILPETMSRPQEVILSDL